MALQGLTPAEKLARFILPLEPSSPTTPCTHTGPLLDKSLHPTELAHLFIPGSTIAHEGWLGAWRDSRRHRPKTFAPMPKSAAIWLTVTPRYVEHRHRSMFVQGCKLPSCTHDTPHGPLWALSQVSVKSGQNPNELYLRGILSIYFLPLNTGHLRGYMRQILNPNGLKLKC